MLLNLNRNFRLFGDKFVAFSYFLSTFSRFSLFCENGGGVYENTLPFSLKNAIFPFSLAIENSFKKLDIFSMANENGKMAFFSENGGCLRKHLPFSQSSENRENGLKKYENATNHGYRETDFYYRETDCIGDLLGGWSNHVFSRITDWLTRTLIQQNARNSDHSPLSFE